MPRRKAAAVGSLIRIITIIATVMHFTFGCCTHPCHLGARDACLPHAAVPATAEACCHDHDHGQEDHALQDSHGEQSGGRLGHAEAGLTPFSAASHGCHGCHCVLMVRCRDCHGINITFHFFEHYSEIFIAFSIREFIKTCFTTSHVNITKGNYVIYTVIVGVCNIRRTFASSTDSRNIEFVARSDESFTKNVAWDNKKTARRNGRTFNKISSAC